MRAPTLPVIMWSGLYARPAQPQPAIRVISLRQSSSEILFIKAEAFVLLGHLLQVSCPLTTFSSPQRLRDYDALHHKRYGLLIHYHALSLMCDRFGIFLFFVALHILRSATSTLWGQLRLV